MHILTIPQTVDLGQIGGMAAGEYLVEDRNGAEIMLNAPGATMREYNQFYSVEGKLQCRPPFSNEGHGAVWEKYPPVSILLIAPIGFGDAILLTPCLRAIKQLHPKATLTIATLREFRQPYLGLPYVDGFEEYPLPVDRLSQYDCVLFLERAIENNPQAKVQHMTDRLAEHLGLGELKDKRADYVVSNSEREWVWASFPKTSKRRIGVQVQAGTHSRSYPRVTLIVEALRRDGWEIFLMGRPGEFRTDGPQRAEVVDLSRRGLSWRESVATLLTCDVFLGPDSSLLHAAGALNIPAVGLFGPYPWKLRTAYYKSVHALQGLEGCTMAPCFHTVHLGLPLFPPDGPCAPLGRCVALDSILPTRIIAKIEQVANAPVVVATYPETPVSLSPP